MSDLPEMSYEGVPERQSFEVTALLEQYNRLMHEYMHTPTFEPICLGPSDTVYSKQLEHYAYMFTSYYSKEKTEDKPKTIAEYITSKLTDLEEVPTSNNNLMYQKGNLLVVIYNGKLDTKYYRILLTEGQTTLVNRYNKYIGASLMEFVRWTE